MSGVCRHSGHGPFENEHCPKCCYHAGQVFLDGGPYCLDCGKALAWVSANQLQDLEGVMNGLSDLAHGETTPIEEIREALSGGAKQ